MPAIQTRPIDDDPQFLTVRDGINRLLARYGFPLVPYKGSATWLGGSACPHRSLETLFKLLYRGRGKPFVFGIRADFIKENEKLKLVQWPIEFSVMPKTDVMFAGFNVEPGAAELATQRVEKILKTLPEPNPALAIKLDGPTDADLDHQLESL
jgi:hypothetical protein